MAIKKHFTMRWDELTGLEFEKAIKKTGGVCTLPIGVLEKHGNHLPIGTDMIFARYVIEKAAEKEPVIIFPDFIFGDVTMHKFALGAISIGIRLRLEMLEKICEEISRNGFKKIILFTHHGGCNFEFLNLFSESMLEKERDFVIYNANSLLPEKAEREERKMMKTSYDRHAGERETSSMMVIAPHLVDKEAIKNIDKKSAGVPLCRIPDPFTPQKNIFWEEKIRNTNLGWYADHSDTSMGGDPTPARKELGNIEVSGHIEYLISFFRAVKKDNIIPQLTKEFYNDCINIYKKDNRKSIY
jgi:creatinine amidohydrolase